MNKSLITKAIQILLLVALAALILFSGRKFFVPIALSGLLSMLFLPLSVWFEKKGMWRGLSSFLCVLTLITGIVLVVSLLGWQMSRVSEDLSAIKSVANDKMEQFQQFANQQLGISRAEQETMMQENKSSGAGGAAKIGASIAGGFLSGLITFIVALVYMFMFLYFRSHFKNFILKLVPSTKKAETTVVITEVTGVAQKYLGGLGLMIVILWVLYSIGFSIAGVKHPVFFAVLCGVLEIVPYVGNLTGTVITLLMAVAQGGDMTMMLGIVIVYAVVQFFQNNILTPLIVGSEVNINPVFTIMALLAGDLVWGISGMILAIPLLGMFKIICDHVEPLKPYGFLLGNPNPKSKGEGGIAAKVKGWFKKSS